MKQSKLQNLKAYNIYIPENYVAYFCKRR